MFYLLTFMVYKMEIPIHVGIIDPSSADVFEFHTHLNQVLRSTHEWQTSPYWRAVIPKAPRTESSVPKKLFGLDCIYILIYIFENMIFILLTKKFHVPNF